MAIFVRRVGLSRKRSFRAVLCRREGAQASHLDRLTCFLKAVICGTPLPRLGSSSNPSRPGDTADSRLWRDILRGSYPITADCHTGVNRGEIALANKAAPCPPPYGSRLQ
jgi:hypothetical protein